jgi:hypothetical protein
MHRGEIWRDGVDRMQQAEVTTYLRAFFNAMMKYEVSPGTKLNSLTFSVSVNIMYHFIYIVDNVLS